MIRLKTNFNFHALHKWVVLVLIFVFGCNPDNDLSFPVDTDFFPLRKGDYRIYQVMETQISPYNNETVFNYEIKTLVIDSIENSEGGYSFIISRFKRDNATASWTSLDSWIARINSGELIVNESNIPYVRLRFPVSAQNSWNGNLYNNEESNEICSETSSSCDIYSFGSVNYEYQTSNGLDFKDCIEVIENDDADLFTKQDIRLSVYARGIGLIYRKSQILNYCVELDCYGKQLVESGKIVKMELTSYGRE